MMGQDAMVGGQVQIMLPLRYMHRQRWVEDLFIRTLCNTMVDRFLSRCKLDGGPLCQNTFSL